MTRPMPESIRQLTRERPCFVSEQPLPYDKRWPLRCADGRTFAERARDEGGRA